MCACWNGGEIDDEIALPRSLEHNIKIDKVSHGAMEYFITLKTLSKHGHHHYQDKESSGTMHGASTVSSKMYMHNKVPRK